jgi:hypothetical protein
MLGRSRSAETVPMIFTVTTLKDTPRNAERFVRRNLAAGVDHLLVFLDADQPEVHRFLADHPHTTPVRADADYWRGRRPANLNLRQVINANLANTALATLPGAAWLFHIDSDEVVFLDRAAALGTSSPALRLEVLEAVSQWSWPDDEVTHFKRLLGADELTLLTALGVIDRPKNRGYFRGYVGGKIGVRPQVDARFRGVHQAILASGQDTADLELPTMGVLHYDSYSGEEFVRKWTAHGGSLTGGTTYHPSRDLVRGALNTLVALEGLAPDRLEQHAARIYERLVRDDFATLLGLGLLTETPRPDHQPVRLDDQDRAHLDTLLDRLCQLEKERFRTTHAEYAARPSLTTAAKELRATNPLVAERIRSALRG